MSITPRLPAIVGFALVLVAGPLHAQQASVRLLHINDVYEISPQRGMGGMAELMTLLERERAGAAHHLTTLGGDLLSPSVMSGLTRGAQMVELMNAIGLDVAGLGNHEFDFGPEVLAQRISESKFTWLATNVTAGGKPLAGTATTLTKQIGELKLGLFSLITPETSHLSSPGEGIVFGPVETAARGAVAHLEGEGVDFVIALTHLDLSTDRALARAVKGIDVILGGHDHDPISVYEGGTLILKAGYDAHYLVAADIAIEKKETKRGVKVSMVPQWRYLSTAGVPAQAAVATLVARHESALDAELAVAVGKTAVELDSRRSTVRATESNLGNLIADAIRAAVKADVALTNGGGIRGNRTYEPGTTLTRKDVLTELPFGNVTVLMEISGADLMAALENGVSKVEDGAGRFPQVSGMRFTFDAKAPPGSRVLEATVAGAPLDPSRTYTLATNDYIANGGDGYSALTQGRLVIDSSGANYMASQVMAYITARGSVSPAVEGRITAR